MKINNRRNLMQDPKTINRQISQIRWKSIQSFVESRKHYNSESIKKWTGF